MGEQLQSSLIEDKSNHHRSFIFIAQIFCDFYSNYYQPRLQASTLFSRTYAKKVYISARSNARRAIEGSPKDNLETIRSSNSSSPPARDRESESHALEIISRKFAPTRDHSRERGLDKGEHERGRKAQGGGTPVFFSIFFPFPFS